MPTVRANNISIAYSEQGNGDIPLVLLHGFPLDKRMWEPQVQALSNEFRIITPDLRGQGESQVPSGPYIMEIIADDIKLLCDSLNLQQVVLGGFSMGGYVAFSFYRSYPERVSSLMLFDTRPQPDSQDAKKGRLDMAQLAEQEGAGVIAERLIPRLLSPDTVANRKDVVDKVNTMITQSDVKGIAANLRGMALRGDSSDLLPNINVPTLIVVGDQDAITPPEEARSMASIIPNATLVEISGAGHLSNMENPDEFNHAIHDFLHHH